MRRKLPKISRRVGEAYPDVFEGTELAKPKPRELRFKLGMLLPWKRASHCCGATLSERNTSMRRDGQPFEEGWAGGRPMGFLLIDMKRRMSPKRFTSFQEWAVGSTMAMDNDGRSIVYYADYYDWRGGTPNYD